MKSLWILGVLLALGVVVGVTALLSSKKNGSSSDDSNSTARVVKAPLMNSAEFQAAGQELQIAQDLERSGKFHEAIVKYELLEKGGIDGITLPATYAAKKLKCFLRRGPNYSVKDRDALPKLVIESLKAANIKKLNQMASCNFYIGTIGSHKMIPYEPEQAVDMIAAKLRYMLWNKEVTRMGKFALLHSTNEKYQLAFERTSGAWSWVGLYTEATNEF